MSRSTARFDAASPSYGHFRRSTGHCRAEFSSRKRPKTAINGDFQGLRAFLAKFVRRLNVEHEIPDSMSRSTARFDAAGPSNGHFGRPTGHRRAEFSSRKRPKTAINGDFPGLCAFFATFVPALITDARSRSTAHFYVANPSYGHFRRPTGHRRAEFSSRKGPKTAANRDVPGLCAFLAKFVPGLHR